MARKHKLQSHKNRAPCSAPPCLDELGVAILACVDYHLSLPSRDREKILKCTGMLSAVLGCLEQHFHLQYNHHQVEKKVRHLQHAFSDEHHDFLQQGSLVLALHDDDRLKVQHALEDLKLKMALSDFSRERQATRSGSKYGVQLKANGKVSQGQQAKAQRTVTNTNGVGKRKRASHETDSMEMTASHCDSVSRSFGPMAGLSRRGDEFKSASRLLEDILSSPTHESPNARLRQVQTKIGSEISMYNERNTELMNKLRCANARITSLEIELMGSNKDLRNEWGELQYHQLQQNWTIAEEQNRHLKAKMPYFDFKIPAQKKDHNQEVEELADTFRDTMKGVLSTHFFDGDDETSEKRIQKFAELLPECVLQHLMGSVCSANFDRIFRACRGAQFDVSEILHSILAAISCSWVLHAPFEELLPPPGVILQNYRSEISEQYGLDSLRALDFLAHKKWLDAEFASPDRREQKARSLAENFLTQFDIGILTDDILSAEDPRMIASVFEAAIDLKLKAMLGPNLFEMRFFQTGTPFDAQCMHSPLREQNDMHPSKLRQPLVGLCIHPALVVWEYDKKCFDYVGFLTPEDSRHRLCTSSHLISPAIVLCADTE